MCVGKSRATASTKELRGSVLDVLRELLAGGHSAEIVELVAKLVSRNKELELLVASLRDKKNRGEQISLEQLDLFLNKLRGESASVLGDANRALEEAANENGGRTEPVKPAKQPSVRRPPPASARRVENNLVVPASERPCPVC